MKNLDLLIPTEAPKPKDRWKWATVTAVSPLTIRLDGETDPLDLVPENLVGGLKVTERVWVQFSGRRAIVTARAGGTAAIEADLAQTKTDLANEQAARAKIGSMASLAANAASTTGTVLTATFSTSSLENRGSLGFVATSSGLVIPVTGVYSVGAHVSLPSAGNTWTERLGIEVTPYAMPKEWYGRLGGTQVHTVGALPMYCNQGDVLGIKLSVISGVAGIAIDSGTRVRVTYLGSPS